MAISVVVLFTDGAEELEVRQSSGLWDRQRLFYELSSRPVGLDGEETEV